MFDLVWTWLVSNNDDRYHYTVAIINDVVISLSYSCNHDVFDIEEIDKDEFFKDFVMNDNYRFMSDDVLWLLQKYKNKGLIFTKKAI